MVRAGVVSHPEQWRHGGYNEIQHRRRKNILVDYATLSRLSGFDDFESFQSAHQRWVQSALSDGFGMNKNGYQNVSLARPRDPLFF